MDILAWLNEQSRKAAEDLQVAAADRDLEGMARHFGEVIAYMRTLRKIKELMEPGTKKGEAGCVR